MMMGGMRRIVRMGMARKLVSDTIAGDVPSLPGCCGDLSLLRYPNIFRGCFTLMI